MKKIIANVEYDTEKAELIRKFTVGSIGESEGYEETLYRTPGGKYFLYLNGGADSQYPEEKIKRLSPANAEQWLKEKQ